MAAQIERLSSPSIEDFRQASEISEKSWNFLESLNCAERFKFFQKIGVELVMAREGSRLIGACFVWPVRYVLENETFEWVWLFQLATVNEENTGTLMLYHTMEWYPAIMCIGLTKQAAKLYQEMRWKSYDSIWRCIHPIALNRLVHDYGDRLTPGKCRLLKLVSIFYNPLMAATETFLALKKPWAPLQHNSALLVPEIEPIHYPLANRLNMMAKYLNIIHLSSSNKDLHAVEFGNVGRIVNDEAKGLTRLRQHAALWSALRNENIAFCEVLATSNEAKRRNLRFGYIPFSMPIYYWENTQKLDSFFEQFHKVNFSFLDTDKLL